MSDILENVSPEYVRVLEAEVERLRAELAQEKDVGLSIADSLGREAKRAEQAEARLAKLQDALVSASGSPKDRDRMDEVIPLMLASYRARAERAEARCADLEASHLHIGKERDTAEAQLAKVTQDYQTLRDAVNASGECTDPEHGERCACHADVMLSNLQTRLARLVSDIGHEADMLESVDASPQVTAFLQTTIERLRALAAVQPEEPKP